MLNSKQYQLLFELTKITESIRIIYEKLKLLEEINQKDSQEYKKNIDYLTICIEVETSKYNEIVNPSDLEELYSYLSKQNKKNCKDTEKLVCYERIRNNIFMKLSNNLKSESYHIDDETEELKISTQKMNVILNMALSNEYEYNILFLSLIDKCITENFSPYTDEFIDLKYDTCFCDRQIEKLVIENNFSINTRNYYMIDDGGELFKQGREEFAQKIAIKTMSKMLSNTDKTISNGRFSFMVFVQMYQLCASLIMLYDTDSFIELKTNFKEMSHKSMYNQSGLKLINKTFDEIPKMKDKNKILTLKV